MKSNDQLFLKSITLNNFATFEDQVITFDNQFNAIIGETGSGKSLILDALQLILGARADKKLIRKSCDYSTIEAIFECHDPKIIEYFDGLGFPFEDNEIIIKRIVYKTGKSKSFLNYQSCSLATIQKFSKRFIDLVGQFENQKLMSESYQLVLLDNFAKHNGDIEEFRNSFAELLTLKEEIQRLNNRKMEQAQRLDYINFQIKELQEVNLSVEDESELQRTKEKIVSIEDTMNSVNSINAIFDGEGHHSASLVDIMSKLERILVSSKTIAPTTTEKYFAAKELLDEVNFEVSTLGQVEFENDELENVLGQLDIYQKLKRKFSTNTDGLEKILTQFITEKDSLSNIEMNLTKLEGSFQAVKKKCQQMADSIHKSRVAASSKLSTQLTKEIRNLRMNGATIAIEITKNSELSITGNSKIALMVETNPGEGLYKVKDIASGGELSRILLAIRQVLSSKDSINVFLFDEIDTGMGGETALHIGKALGNVSTNSQVIAITHLPQIANFATKLVIVSKKTTQLNDTERTISCVKEVVGAGVKKEVNLMTPLN